MELVEWEMKSGNFIKKCRNRFCFLLLLSPSNVSGGYSISSSVSGTSNMVESIEFGFGVVVVRCLCVVLGLWVVRWGFSAGRIGRFCDELPAPPSRFLSLTDQTLWAESSSSKKPRSPVSIVGAGGLRVGNGMLLDKVLSFLCLITKVFYSLCRRFACWQIEVAGSMETAGIVMREPWMVTVTTLDWRGSRIFLVVIGIVKVDVRLGRIMN